MNGSLDEKYYEENSEEYFNSTVNIDPGSFLNPLLKLLSPGSTVLDLGCGSGRGLDEAVKIFPPSFEKVSLFAGNIFSP